LQFSAIAGILGRSTEWRINPIHRPMSNRVTHFEIPADDPEKAMTFFHTVFGWSFQRFGDQDYWLAQTGDSNAPGINGAIMKKRDPNQPITHSIDVADLDQKIQIIEEAGGTIVVPKTPIPGAGWFCFFKDPDGHIHGMMQENTIVK
jgi:hypothetical protein